MRDLTSIIIDKANIKNEVSQLIDRELSTLTLSSKSDFNKKGEEVAMTYNQNILEPYALLEHYGFVVDNNIFASLTLTVSNVEN